jgi:PAS domain S-box-containing protein
MIFSIAIMGILVALIKAQNWERIAHIFITVNWVIVLVLVYFSGGLTSPVLPSLILIPILALIFLPHPLERVWVGICIGCLVLLFLSPGPAEKWTYVSPWPGAFNATIVVGLLLMTYTITRSFRTQQDHLLSSAEENNEELRAAEEELRQSIEELSATQDALAAKEAEAASIINSLREHFLVQEIDKAGVITYVNNKTKNFSGLPEVAFEGKNFNQFFTVENAANGISFKWKRLLAGQSTEFNTKLLQTKDELWMLTTLAPIIDNKGTVSRILSIGQDITRLKNQEREISQLNEKLYATLEDMAAQNAVISIRQDKTQRYLDVLIELAKSKGIVEGDMDLAYEEILSSATSVLDISRIGIWRFDKFKRSIECLALCHHGKKTEIKSLQFYESQVSPYITAVAKEGVIVAEDAATHPATSCFNTIYLKPNNIKSMLDVPYFEHGAFAGVLCCEQEENYRIWEQEDIIFVKSIGDLLSMAVNASLRKRSIHAIEIQKEKIIEQNKQLTRFASEIAAINESLELRVAERTMTLNEQNKKLMEYAFVNAHLLRGPLSRIMGLVELIKIERSSDEIQKLAELLITSAKELDGVVHRITTILHEGKPVDRNILRE